MLLLVVIFVNFSEKRKNLPTIDLMASTDNETAQNHSGTSESKNSVQGTINEADEDRPEDDVVQQRQIEQEEEKKLKARHPCIQRPGSEFLQKRLQRGQKYFDSGDYNMAKASTNPNIKLLDGTTPVTSIDSKLQNKRH